MKFMLTCAVVPMTRNNNKGNRQNPKIVAAYRNVLADDAILMSQDRWCAYRPTAGNPEWRTRGNLHLDVQPWGYVGGDTNIEELQYATTLCPPSPLSS